jgi:hypothetical protein
LKEIWYRCSDGSFKKIKTNENEYFMRKFLTSIFEKLADKTRKKEPLITVLEEKIKLDESLPKVPKTSKKRKPRSCKNVVSVNTPQELFPSISPQQMKLISIAGEIRLDQDKTESAFMARQLVQATLPHKNPGNVPAWSRTNGNLTLTIRPGWDENKKKLIGYPYGTIPRLLLFWITTEAIRTKSPRIELGDSLSQFMEALGLYPKGTGKRSDSKRLKEQMVRLSRSTISFSQSSSQNYSWLDMQVAPKGMVWWNEKQPNQRTLWQNWIQLGDDFFKAISSSPVPVDMRILKALKRSPLSLDLYAWATYTAYQTQQTGKSRSLSWEILHEQFGAEYKDTKEFSRKAWNALLKVQAVYPELNVERVRGGILVLPSKPSITIKQKKIKNNSI